MDLTSELVIVLSALSGGITLLTIALKRTWSGADAADDAFVRGLTEAKAQHRDDLHELRAEFRTQLDIQGRRYRHDLEVVEAHVQRLHRALAALVALVAPEHMAEATAVLIELGLPIPDSTPPHEGDTP